MPAWNDLLNQFQSIPEPARPGWLLGNLTQSLVRIGNLRGNRHVLLYASAFLQKPQAPGELISITGEDLNAFMSVIYGMEWSRGLTLMLHTPGGQTNATETILAYVRSKFASVEVIVPTFAMSAGTMISLGSDRVVMGRQSQLGPIDPQIPMGGGRQVSARAVVEQFERTKADILANPLTAHAWAPAVQTIGPSLLQEAQNALDYGESMVAGWLAQYMFSGQTDAGDKGKAVARHFNDASTHKSHGRRIDREEARNVGVVVEDLENDQQLQEAVLTAYHLGTIIFEQSPIAKILASDTNRQWVKSWGIPTPIPTPSPPPPPRGAAPAPAPTTPATPSP